MAALKPGAPTQPLPPFLCGDPMDFSDKAGTIPAVRHLRRFFFFLALALLHCLLSAAGLRAQEGSPSVALVLKDMTVVDVREGRLRPHQTVVIEQGLITSIVAAKSTKFPSGATVVDAHGLFLIPGLWDMHVHLAFGDWFPGARDITLPLFVANGVTGVRDMGSDLAIVQGWRKEISSGNVVGPRIFTSGPMLDGPKPRFPSSVAITTPEDGRRAVDDLKKQGADFIKFQSLIPRDAVFAITEEAKKQQIAFAGHVPDSVRASEMSAAGMKSFEHLIGIFEGSSPLEDEFLKGDKSEHRFLASYDPARAGSLAALLAKNQTWQCPTLVWERGGNLLDVSDFTKDTRAKYAPASWKTGAWQRFTDEILQGYSNDDLATRKKFVDKELEIVQLLHRAGVPFLAGTDTPPGVYVFPGFSLHEELQRFVAAGFSPLEALQTATVNAARFVGMEDRSGTVEKGKIADLVLLSANPLENISNTQNIFGVVANGRYFSRAGLDKLLTDVESAASK